MERVLDYIDERVNKLNDDLQNTRKRYAAHKHDYLAWRINELSTAIEELEKVAVMIINTRPGGYK